jgi:DNA-binding winged helix-turn-helix (wHTH) protein
MVRFGVFEVDFRSRELRKHGSRIKLQSKPFQILEGLVEKRGEIVNREELRLRLWPGDTFVDFETGLNSAVKRLRDALGDSAEHPRYIETVSRQGYRFIAPVEQFTEPQPANDFTSPVVVRQQASLTTRALVSRLVWLLAGLVIASGFAYIVSRQLERRAVNFRQLTFRRGHVTSARFAPDGGVVYAAQWSSGGRQLFLTNSLSPESRPLGVQGMTLASVSASGELALLASDGTTPIAGATLLRTPMHGGAPAEVERNIMGADWSADGKALAIVRVVDGMNQLEFPVGKVLYRTSGWLSGVRVSPSNRLIAFFEHPVRHDDAGTVKLIDATGRVRALGGEWAIARGLAWHPSGQEVWFTATRDASASSLWASSVSGNLRPIGQTAGGMVLYDISRDGHILFFGHDFEFDGPSCLACRLDCHWAAREAAVRRLRTRASIGPGRR